MSQPEHQTIGIPNKSNPEDKSDDELGDDLYFPSDKKNIILINKNSLAHMSDAVPVNII
jgi:hypothetical protein